MGMGCIWNLQISDDLPGRFSHFFSVGVSFFCLELVPNCCKSHSRERNLETVSTQWYLCNLSSIGNHQVWVLLLLLLKSIRSTRFLKPKQHPCKLQTKTQQRKASWCYWYLQVLDDQMQLLTLGDLGWQDLSTCRSFIASDGWEHTTCAFSLNTWLP